MKKIGLLWLWICIGLSAFAQGEDFATATTFTPTCITGYSASGCGTTTYNLGASTSSQTPSTGVNMGNDVWFKFTAPTELVKVKVCDPTVDVAIEVWNSTGTTMLSAVNLSASTGTAGKEYMCVGGLTLNGMFYVRVGRVSGSGAGTFAMKVEYNLVELRDQYSPLWPSPGGDVCYTPGSSVKRTNPCALPVSTTRWKFVDPFGNVTVCVGQGDQVLSGCANFCLDGLIYMVSCEVRGNDTECGNIYWGYGPAKPIQMCSSTCIPISSPSNNSVVTNFTTQLFSAQTSGYQYQWKFTTDNGATTFCSGWTTNANSNATDLGLLSCFTFNKIYQVQMRAKVCSSEPDPAWCSPITFSTSPLPYITVQSGTCCLWRNKNGGTISANPVSGVNQYRWRFTPIDPCASSPLSPIGPACVTSWGTSSSINPNGLPCIAQGTIYLVQVQGRRLATTCNSCTGGTNNITGAQTDWGPACIVGFRATNSPPVGTAISCYCTPNMIANDDIPENPFGTIMDFTTTRDEQVLTASMSEGQVLNVDLSESDYEGTGTLQVISLNGQVIETIAVHDLGINPMFNVTVSEPLSPGIYVITISGNMGTTSTKVFITKE